VTSDSRVEELELRIRDLERRIKCAEVKEHEFLRKNEKTQKAENYLRTLLENTEDAILISDAKGVPQMFNDAYAKAMKELLGLDMKPGIQPHKLLQDPEAIAYWDELHRRALAGEKFSAEFSHQFGDSIRHFEHVFCPIVRDDQVAGFSEVTREITARVDAEQGFRESESKY